MTLDPLFSRADSNFDLRPDSFPGRSSVAKFRKFVRRAHILPFACEVVIAPRTRAVGPARRRWDPRRITTSQANGKYALAYEFRNLATLIAPGNYPAAVKS